ncbi:helix-turn-helix domain-containing protein [Microbacterium sp. VKM Ac-2923]|uniref:helix-turn-helix domain-containing protein n=1 Tax=Microbacterium sp. VKM Ac-2923 TaxID=2929476 RepID=UPI001FB55A06|nr:helix-turn-helix domain-containing protein [Microbacterium sp. VKM Ac-2923]MCJ1708192.1 helix-turn-helix domain-containing protein [Microbacterium sp. VKM Ac-2923]
MVLRRSVKRERELRQFGAHLRLWRKVNGWSASLLAERASVTRETLKNLEEGTGAVRVDSLFAVLGALGIADTVVRAADPHNSDAARARIDGIISAGGRL